MTYDPVDTNDDGVVDADVDNELVKTEKQLVGTSWTDVLASRSFDTWHQAPTDRDIAFVPQANATAAGTTIHLIIDINDSQSSNFITQSRAVVDGGKQEIGPITVPAGQYYRVQTLGDTADYNLEEWYERR